MIQLIPLIEKQGVPNIHAYVKILNDKIIKILNKGAKIGETKFSIEKGIQTIGPLKINKVNGSIIIKRGQITKVEGSVLFKNSIINLDIILTVDIFSPFNSAQIEKEISAVLYHELTHVYEEYMRSLSPLKLNISQTETSVYEKISSIIMSHSNTPMNELFVLIYLSAAYEINARISQVYQLIKGIKDPKDREKAIKETMQWQEAKALITFNADNYYNNIKKLAHIQNANEDDIKDMFKRLSSIFLDGSTQMINKLISDLNLDTQEGRLLKSIISKNIVDIQHVMNKEPIQMLKYFEKKFNKAGENLRRRLLRLATYEENE